MQGALVLSPEDVLKDFGVKANIIKPSYQLSIAEELVCQALVEGELHFEELLEKTELSVNELSSLLMQMEINDLVDKVNGNYYQLK
jgi:DNA processing protein